MFSGLVATLTAALASISSALAPPAVHAPAASGGAAPSSAAIALPHSAAKLLGQRIMVGMTGTVPGGALLDQVRRGEVGSVILFASNIVSRGQLTALTGALQGAAGGGGNPPLLIAVDQEGGEVKRLEAGPPDLSPPQIAARGSTAVAAREGRATGAYLRSFGINMDLAPVLDVPTFPGAFIWREGRAFSMRSADVVRYATPFALGIQSQRVAATGKHFPGVGSAAVDTDDQLDELRPTAAQRTAALAPYESLIPRGLDAVMVSTAGYPAYDATGTPAALSRPIIQGLLRGKLGFKGVAITDSLATPTGHDEITAGRLAARAGADILLFTDDAPGELGALESDLGSGRLARSDAQAAYRRIVALKQRVAR